jgi:hypothetical protein
MPLTWLMNEVGGGLAQANGSTFDGMWVHGRKHGSGCYMWATGALYDGEWREGAMQGFGRCVNLSHPAASIQSVVQRLDQADGWLILPIRMATQSICPLRSHANHTAGTRQRTDQCTWARGWRIRSADWATNTTVTATCTKGCGATGIPRDPACTAGPTALNTTASG